MRYIKVLLLACLFFVALVFFFQNQAALTSKLDVKLNLFFMSEMKSMALPLYFLMICSFFIGVLFSVCFLVWDRLNLSARIMKDKWQIQNLANQLAKAEKMVKKQNKQTFSQMVANFFSLNPAEPVRSESEVRALSSKDKPVVSKLPPKSTQPAPKIEATKPIAESTAAKQPA
ncbi:MAG: DUF1049 domain-containing protein [Desulfovibrio sp.]|nr:DUF1049 domain-containing protein [Desulfovibrio sp.]